METIAQKLELHTPGGLDMVGTSGYGILMPGDTPLGGLETTLECWYKGPSADEDNLIDNSGYLPYITEKRSDNTGNIAQFFARGDGSTFDLRMAGNKIVRFEDAGNEYMTFPAYNPVGDSFTIELLVRNTQSAPTDWARILSLGHSTGSGKISLTYHSGDYWYWHIEDDSAVSKYPGLVDYRDTYWYEAHADFRAWHHVAIVVDRSAGTARAFIDGNLSSATSLSGFGNITIDTASLGRLFSGGNGAEFECAYLRIWSTARSEADLEDDAYKLVPTGTSFYERAYTWEDGDETDFEGAQDGTFAGAPAVDSTKDEDLNIALTAEDLEGWHHLAFVHDATGLSGEGKVYFYLDGELYSSQTTQRGKPMFGGNANAIMWLLAGTSRGVVDDVRWWNEARTQAEIQDNMFLEMVGTETNLQHNFKLEDGSGTTATDACGNQDGTVHVTNTEWVDGCPNAGPGWESLYEDLVKHAEFSWEQGIQSLGPSSVVASPGPLNFTLKNSSGNSGGTAGYYSPDNSAVRDGFRLKAQIRVGYTYGGVTDYKYYGYITDIDPDPADMGPRVTVVKGYDWMGVAQKQPITGLQVQTDKRGDQAIESLMALTPITMRVPMELDTGKSTWPYIFDAERDEVTKVTSILQKIAMSEKGQIYLNGKTLIFENRHHKIDETDVKYDFDQNTPTLNVEKVKYGEETVITRVKGLAHPREIDDSNVVLATSQNVFSLGSGETLEDIQLYFRDPNGDARVSALSIVDPLVANTDYTANSNEDGSGSDLTSDITITITSESGNSITVSITNSGGSLAYITLLQVRGKGMYRYDPMTTEKSSDQETIDKYGDLLFTYDVVYEDDINVVKDFRDSVLSDWETPIGIVTGLSYFPEFNADLAQAFMDIEKGHRITLARDLIGIDQDYFVQKIRTERVGGLIKCTYDLAPEVSTAWARCDDNVYGELGADVCKAAF